MRGINIEIKDIFRKENDYNCRKCGMSLNNPQLPHNEKECDYVQILPEHIAEAIKVDDIELTDIKISGGYGIWELCKIHDIMMKLWNSDNPKYKRRVVSREYPTWSSSLFDEAKKIYEEDG